MIMYDKNVRRTQINGPFSLTAYDEQSCDHFKCLSFDVTQVTVITFFERLSPKTHVDYLNCEVISKN